MATPAETTTALVTAAPPGAITLTNRAALMRARMKEELEIRAIVRELIDATFVENVDFGKIPGTDKPTLLKPGAEKLVTLFHCVPDFDVTTRVEQWDVENGLFHYEIRTTLRDQTGTVIAIGMGSANSREGRYRWRNGERKCPDCGKPAIKKSKFDDGGWYCFAKVGGCGAKFDAKDPAIVDQVVGKVENDDIATLVNTILKMAKKRSLVDAAIALARCSDLFTQDVEDLQDPDHGERGAKRREDHQEHQHRAANGNGNGHTNGNGARPDVFMPKAKWEGAEHWSGKLLTDAPVEVLRVYHPVIVEVADKTTNGNAKAFLTTHLEHITAAIAGDEPPPAAESRTPSSPGTEAAPAKAKRVRRGGTGDAGEPVAMFSGRIAWGGSSQWTGVPLTDAPLDVLLVYADAVQADINDPVKESYRESNLRHLDHVDAAIAKAEVAGMGGGAS